MLNTAQGNPIVCQHLHVILEVLANFLNVSIFQQWLHLLQYLPAVQLLRRTGVIMRQRHISGFSRLNSKRQPNNFSLHGVQVSGFGVESKNAVLNDFIEPAVQCRLFQQGFVFCICCQFVLNASKFRKPGLELQAGIELL